MNDLKDILEKLQLDFENDIPALLVAEGVDDFQEYVIGPSRDSEKRALCILVEETNEDDARNILEILLHLQLPSIDYLVSTQYEKVVVDYMKSYNLNDLGMNIIDNINVEFWPIENDAVTFVLITILMREELDSCD